MMAKPLVFDAESGGHRDRGARLLAAVIGGDWLIARPRDVWKKLVGHRATLLWQTADYSLLALALVAVARASFGRRTVGLCYRNDAVPVRKRLKAHLRRILLKSLARAPFIQMLRIYPPLVHQQCDRNWIYDPEWWDLSIFPVDAAPAVIPNSCGPVVMFIGNISRVKGIDYFIETAALASKSNSTLQFTIVGLGDRLTKRQRESFVSAGGFIVSGVFSDEEFVGFMKRAQFLWCCYDPEYNQSSGIFGRALQLGIPPITRSGSLLANWVSQLNFGLQVEFGDATGLIQALLAADVTARIPEEAIFQMRELSVERLHAACFTAPSPSDGS